MVPASDAVPLTVEVTAYLPGSLIGCLHSWGHLAKLDLKPTISTDSPG